MERLYFSVLAGLAIGIAAICNLASGGIIGAALFAFALSAIVCGKWRSEEHTSELQSQR